MASIHVGRSEDEVGEKVDRCLADGLIKTAPSLYLIGTATLEYQSPSILIGAGAAIGVVFSVLFFKRKGWPVAFGIGTGTGMAISNCQHEFRRMFPGVAVANIESSHKDNIVTNTSEPVEEKLPENS